MTTPDTTPAVRTTATPSPTTPPAEWSVIVSQAEILARSSVVPSAYRGRPENVIAAAITGRTFGWDVMAAMRNGHVIEGTYAIRPEAQVGLVRGAGHSITGEATSSRATVTGVRADTGDTMTVEWTLDDAKAAGLLGKSNWRQYPSDMLWARAVSQLCRRLFPDVTLGLSYTPDELGDQGDAFTDRPARADAAPPVVEVVEAEVVDLPVVEGWESHEACQAAHDAFRDRVRASDADVVRRWQQYLKESGYSAPFTRTQFDELEAELEILLGTTFERKDTLRQEPAGEARTGDDGNVNGRRADAPVGVSPSPAAIPAPDPQPVAVEPEAEALSPVRPVSGSSPKARKAQLNRLGALCSDLGLSRDVRLAVARFVAGEELDTASALTVEAAEWMIAALRMVRDGHIAIEALDDGVTFVILDPTDGLADPQDLKGTRWLAEFAEWRGLEFGVHDQEGDDDELFD
jgi:hypothetical protein